jgi:hypothetical protein
MVVGAVDPLLVLDTAANTLFNSERKFAPDWLAKT